jgi:hypothetical protein
VAQAPDDSAVRHDPAPPRARTRTLGSLALILALTIEVAAIAVAVISRAGAPLQRSAVTGDQVTAFVVVQGVAMLVPIVLGLIAALTGRGRALGVAAATIGLVSDLLVIWALFAAIVGLLGYLFSGGP